MISPELLAARESLLEGIVATWPKRVPKSVQPPRDLIVIDMDAERAKVWELHRKWQAALAAKNAAVATASADHSTPGDHYWEAERAAYGLYLAASNFIAALEAARR